MVKTSLHIHAVAGPGHYNVFDTSAAAAHLIVCGEQDTAVIPKLVNSSIVSNIFP